MATTKHTCSTNGGWRKDPNCPRCQELIAGAPAVQQAWRGRKAHLEAYETLADVRAHFASHKHRSGGCGPVCTYGEA